MRAPLDLLVISYHLADGTSEGLVSARLVEALAAAGHRVRVMAHGPGGAEPAEGPFEELLGAARVRRVSAAPEAGPAWWRLLDRASQGAGASLLGPLGGRLAALPNLLHGAGLAEHVWIHAAADAALAWAREDGEPQVLHSRLNPVASHRTARAVRRRRPAWPWCASWSDPWPHHLYPDPYHYRIGPLSRRRLGRLGRSLLTAPDRLVFPGARLRNFVFQSHGLDRAEGRGLPTASVIPHLGTGRDLPEPPPLPPGDALVLRHAGSLGKERRVEPLVAALARLVAARPEVAGHLRLELAGRAPVPAPEIPPEVAGMVRFEKPMAAGEVPAWLLGAPVSLLVEARLAEGVFFPAKLAEYLALGRPILALSPASGTAADLLAEGGGLRAAPDDPGAIAAALAELWDRWHAPETHGPLSDLAPTASQRRSVSPAGVVPLWEEAFEATRRSARERLGR